MPVFDDGMAQLPEAVLQARIQREAVSTDRFKLDMQDIRTLLAFSEWLHRTHLCYAVPRQPELGRPDAVDGKALASY